MRRLLMLLLLCLGAGCARPEVSPRLVVVLVVDQMRADYLDRFDAAFSGGLRRMLDEGVVFERCGFGHAMTGTAPGHATLSTGCDPRQHGVFEQVWFDREQHQEVVFTQDDEFSLLEGVPGEGVSPRRMRRDTLGDWLKASSPDSKVYAAAIKARAAVALGGQRPDAAFWYDPTLPGGLSSRYYLEALPAWVEEFNAQGLLTHFRALGWDPLLAAPLDEAGRADEAAAGDDAPYGRFPHRFDEGFARQIRSSPHGDDLTLRFVQRLVEEEELGRDDDVDLLWVGLSAADYIGHLYGPFSLEVQDYFLRLDGYLQRFFAALDETVGKGRYVVALTSDHGVAPIPERVAYQGADARRVVLGDYLSDLDRIAREVQTELSLPQSPLAYANYEGVWLDREGAAQAGGSSSLVAAFTRRLLELPYVEEVFGPDVLEGPRPAPASHAEAYWRSFVPGRGPDLMLCFPEYWLVGTFPAGTNHGTPYAYDTHVPCLVMGAGLTARRVATPIEPIDLAPTLADLMRVGPTHAVDGVSRWDLARRGS